MEEGRQSDVIQILSLYLQRTVSGPASAIMGLSSLPLIVDCLDVEAERRAHGIDILAHDFLDDCGLPGIVKSSKPVRSHRKLYVFCLERVTQRRTVLIAYSINILNSLSLSLALRSIESMASGMAERIGRRLEVRGLELQSCAR